MPIEIPSGTTIGYGRSVIATLATPISLPTTGLSLLLGRNGAGKSTFMKYLCGCLSMRPLREYRTVYLPEELDFHDDMPPRAIASACLESVSTFRSLSQRLMLDTGKPWRTLSKGNRQKARTILTIALAEETNAQLVCLDEMMSGLDYAIRRVLWEVLRDLKAKHHVLISMHPEVIREKPDQVIGVAHRRIFRFSEDVSEWPDFERILENITPTK